MASSKLIFAFIAAFLVSAHAQVVLDSSLYNPQAEQVTVQRVYPITVTNTQTSVQLRTAYDVQQQETETVTLLPSLTEQTTTIVNPTVTIAAPRPQTLVQTVERTVYLERPQQVVRTVVNSVVTVQAQPEPVAVTVTVTQTVAVRPRIRILPTTVVRTTLITETLPYQEPAPLETITATAYVTTTLLLETRNSIELSSVALVTSTIWERQGPGGPGPWTAPGWATNPASAWNNNGPGAWNNNNNNNLRAPDTNTYTTTTNTDNSKLVATKTETTYFPNAAPASAVGLRYATGSFWTRSNVMQLCLLGTVLVASQAILAKLFA